MTDFLNKLPKYAPSIVRIGMSLVFLWFGVSQGMSPSNWTSLVPQFASDLVGGNPLILIYLNSWFEIIAGLCLITGLQVRIASLLLALHLFGIAGSFGWSPLGVRDFGLSVATLSVFFAGADIWSLDTWFVRRKQVENTVKYV